MSTEGWRAADAGWILARVRAGLPKQSPRLSRKWRKHDSPKGFETGDNLLTLFSGLAVSATATDPVLCHI